MSSWDGPLRTRWPQLQTSQHHRLCAPSRLRTTIVFRLASLLPPALELCEFIEADCNWGPSDFSLALSALSSLPAALPFASIESLK
jgi:hypothetical protein